LRPRRIFSGQPRFQRRLKALDEIGWAFGQIVDTGVEQLRPSTKHTASRYRDRGRDHRLPALSKHLDQNLACILVAELAAEACCVLRHSIEIGPTPSPALGDGALTNRRPGGSLNLVFVGIDIDADELIETHGHADIATLSPAIGDFFARRLASGPLGPLRLDRSLANQRDWRVAILKQSLGNLVERPGAVVYAGVAMPIGLEGPLAAGVVRFRCGC